MPAKAKEFKLAQRLKTVKLTEITPYQKNAKSHSVEQVDTVKRSIKKYQYLQPIGIDKDNVIVMGHCRYKALCEMDPAASVEVVDCSHLSAKKIKALRVMDNKSNESIWDVSTLVEDMTDICGKDTLDKVTLEDCGFLPDEIATMLPETKPAEPKEDDDEDFFGDGGDDDSDEDDELEDGDDEQDSSTPAPEKAESKADADEPEEPADPPALSRMERMRAALLEIITRAEEKDGLFIAEITPEAVETIKALVSEQ